MRSDREKAINLRKTGKSYKEIRDELKVPLSTLSDWFSGQEWSTRVKERLVSAHMEKSKIRLKELGRVRGERLERVYAEAREEAKKELDELRYNPLFIAGMMLYWGEGDKVTKSHVRLSNSDPNLIKLYITFLQQVCRIPEERIRLQLLIYPDIDIESNKRFWSFSTGMPFKHFTKSIVIEGRHKTKKLSHGVCTVVVSSTYFKVKITEWLKVFPQELMKREYYENI